MEKYQPKLEELTKKEAEARRVLAERIKEAEGAKESRKKIITEEIEKQEARAVNYRQQKAALADEVANALLAGKSDNEINELNGKIAALDEAERDVVVSITALKKHNVANAEKDSVISAVAAYREARNASADLLAFTDKIMNYLKAEIERLEKEIKKIEQLASAARAHRNIKSTDSLHLLALYEKAFGAVDVTGHHIGTDQDAKLRFIAGNMRGLENIPAADKEKCS